ncbi:MAG: isoaspartyl peptidase/L-asparaginase [Planctomycetes bacterium]|nr:isoaspartyl peptidase/L-asparaginase [Planctomycetota bacterium]
MSVTPKILVHGGAGAMRSMGGEREAAYRAGLVEAARLGREALRAGDALEAVLVAVRHMEACGAFNAGVGSCLDEDGRFSLDAALMRGSDRAAGAVGACAATVHPTDVARALLEEGRHVLLVGEGAERRARALGLPALGAPPEEKLETYRRLLADASKRAPEDLSTVGRPDDEQAEDSQDTVGAVAVDARGRVAAAVSTGGLWLKLRGRVGDSAIPGAGLYACDALGGASSTTGIGERMIRALTAKLACDLIAAGADAQAAAQGAVDDLAQRFGPDSGGIVVVDRLGRLGAAFNTQGMGRALASLGDEAVPVAVWPEEPFPLD